IIGAVGNNGTGMVGVNWQVRIMPLKFLDANLRGNDSDAIRAIDFAIQNGARVFNTSWGAFGIDPLLLAAVQRARDAGVLVCAAAGNFSNNNDSRPFCPAS